jgi:hypothetical protein
MHADYRRLISGRRGQVLTVLTKGVYSRKAGCCFCSAKSAEQKVCVYLRESAVNSTHAI